MKVPSNTKICLTCRYWTGNRNVNGASKLVECENNDTGKCINMKGFYN